MNLARAVSRSLLSTVALAGVVFASAAPSVHAAPVERKLGDGLLYFRVHTVPEDLPTAEAARSHACILDLRYAAAAPVGGTLLDSWLKFHTSDRTPVFVLINGSTAAPLVRALRHEVVPGLLTVGVAAQKFEPDIMVAQDAQDERRAYEAFEHGTDVATLTTDYPDKQRNDEASLAQNRSTDDSVPGDDDGAVIPDTPAAKPPQPTDAALERAIHVYQGLRAMKRL